MKLSTNKCNLLDSCIKYEQKWIKIGNDKKWQSAKSTALDIKFVQSKIWYSLYHSFSQAAGHLKFWLNKSLNISCISRFLIVATQSQESTWRCVKNGIR